MVLTLDIQGYPVRIGVWTPRTSKGSKLTPILTSYLEDLGSLGVTLQFFVVVFSNFEPLENLPFQKPAFFGNLSQHHQPQTSIPQKNGENPTFRRTSWKNNLREFYQNNCFIQAKKAQSDNLWKLTAGSPQSGMVFPSSGSSPFPGGPFSGSSFFFWQNFWLGGVLVAINSIPPWEKEHYFFKHL